MQKLCVLYDEFRFSTELIDYLISYVAGLDKFKNGSRRGVIEYATRVAVTWNENHITTPAEAADYLRRSQGNYYKILSFLGSRSHTPQDKEIAFMSKWLDTYGFSMEIIKEACGRAVLKKKDNATLNYVDKILTSWHLNGADTLEKIALLDDEHKKSSSADTKSVSPQGSSAKKNSFNDFPQRTYDWDEIQSRLTGVDKR